MRPPLILALVLAALAGPALANEGASAPDSAGQHIDMAPVGIPIVADGRLVNYVFVSVRITLSPQADSPRLREKEPYFRDALVRMAHRTPFTNPADYTQVDGPRLRAAMLSAVVAITGPGAVRSIEILNAAPQKRWGFPRPAAATRR